MVLRYGEPFSLHGSPKKGRSRKNWKVFGHFAFIVIFVVSFFFANLYATQEFVSTGESRYTPRGVTRSVARLPVAPPFNTKSTKPVVCIVMDDVGRDKDLLNTITKIPFPMTLSVLPDCDYTKESAEWAHHHGYEVMVHLPMQPESYREEEPEEHPLMLAMNAQEIVEETGRALSEVPYAVGVNNHMGSLFTTRRGKLDAVLDVLAQRNLYFIDSRTAARSIGYELAHEKGIPSSERTLFLDDINDPEPIRVRFQELILKAREEGQALGICHFRPETIAVLSALDPDQYSDIRFTFPSQIVR